MRETVAERKYRCKKKRIVPEKEDAQELSRRTERRRALQWMLKLGSLPEDW